MSQLVLKNRDQFLTFDKIVTESREMIESTQSHLERAYVQACALVQLRAAFTPDVLKPFKAMAGTKLGFKADKEYPDEVVRDAIIEASLRGLRPYGNEFNIIGGQMYATQEGLERLVNEKIDAGTVVDHKPEVPLVDGAKWSVRYVARYTKNGKQHIVERTFSGKWNGYSSDDQVLGKSRRKILHEIHRQLTGLSLGEGSVDEREVRNVSSSDTAGTSTGFELKSTDAKAEVLP